MKYQITVYNMGGKGSGYYETREVYYRSSIMSAVRTIAEELMVGGWPITNVLYTDEGSLQIQSFDEYGGGMEIHVEPEDA